MTDDAGSHDADELIRELIQNRRVATPAEIAEIIERMASAPFDPRLKRVPMRDRGLEYLGRRLGSREPSLQYHAVKRVVVEEQWVAGTTEEQYLDDLRRAVRDNSARLAVYERRGGHMAATLTPTAAVVPGERQTPRSLESVLVVYSADRACVVSGYQVTGLETVTIPEDALWLR